MKMQNSTLIVVLGFLLASAVNADAVVENVNDIDSTAKFEFSAGAITVYFTNCKGIGTQSELEQPKPGYTSDINHGKTMGRTTVKNFTCSRNIGKSLDLWNWRQQVVDGKGVKASLDATLIAYDETFTPVAEWTFIRAWPVSIDYNETAPGQETVVFAADRVQRTR